MLGCTAAR
jgi:hypothetical protein